MVNGQEVEILGHRFHVLMLDEINETCGMEAVNLYFSFLSSFLILVPCHAIPRVGEGIAMAGTRGR